MMLRAFLTAALLGLGACNTPGPLVSPAPLAHTTVDEKAYGAVLLSFDAALTLVDQKLAAGTLQGREAAKVAAALQTAYDAVQIMKAARAAGSETDPARAYVEAYAAVDALHRLLKGK